MLAVRKATEATKNGHASKLTLFLTFAGSGFLLALAEFAAANSNRWLPFYIFWVGYFAVVLPISRLLASHSTREADLGFIVFALAVWSLLPKWIRTGDQPLYFDEFSHLRLLQDLLRVGHPVPELGLLQIGSSFPGLELVTSAVAQVSGAHVWWAAMFVAAISHVAILIGIFVLVGELASSKRAGALAALFYSLNPSWLFFDSQYAYETLALPLLLWGLVFTFRAITRTSNRPSQSAAVSIGLAALFSLSLVITHHVTAVFNCFLLTAIACIVSLRQRTSRGSLAESAQIAWLLAAWALATTAARFIGIGRPLAVYLSPVLDVSSEFHQLLGFLGISSSLPLRTAFSNSGLPRFEVLCGYLLPFVLLFSFGWAAWVLLGKRRELSSFAYVAAIAGLGYFVSLPLLTAVKFSEAVHRSWALSYIGLAVVTGLAVDIALRGELNSRLHRKHVNRLRRPYASWIRAVPIVLLGIAAIGGVATATTAAYRFGGPVVFGEDAASIGTQTSMVSQWFHDHALQGQRVFADRYVGGPIAINSVASVVAPAAWWGITFDPQVSPQLASRFGTITYVVVDRRMASGKPPPQGYWYAPAEPHALTHYVIPSAQVLRFQCFNWLHALYATADYEILKVDHSQLESDVLHGTNGLEEACLPKMSAP